MHRYLLALSREQGCVSVSDNRAHEDRRILDLPDLERSSLYTGSVRQNFLDLDLTYFHLICAFAATADTICTAAVTPMEIWFGTKEAPNAAICTAATHFETRIALFRASIKS